MITVRRYTDEDRSRWDALVTRARTRTVLFARSFMDYHRDRFVDHSLLVFDRDELVALLPASRTADALVSHGGLTFGGLLVGREESDKRTLLYLSALLRWCHEAGIPRLVLKQSPSFYSAVSQDVVDYGLFLADAKLARVDLAFAVDQRLAGKIGYQERRSRAIKKALGAGARVGEVEGFRTFWDEILAPNLRDRFGVAPVHSAPEIERLCADNPGCIRPFGAWLEGRLVAGCVIFETTEVAHAQYISATDDGRSSGAIDLLFHHLLTEVYAGKHVFDFGIVNEAEGRRLNVGLLDWKEGFGARAYAHRFYEVSPGGYAGIDAALAPAKDGG